MAFRFQRLHIHDVVLVETQAFGDDRGFFVETYRQFLCLGAADSSFSMG